MVIGFVVQMTFGVDEAELASAMEDVARTDPMRRTSTMW